MKRYELNNGYGTTYYFEIVDRIPAGYIVWNIGEKHKSPNKARHTMTPYQAHIDILPHYVIQSLHGTVKRLYELLAALRRGRYFRP